jgi:hypothetical protein
MKRLALAMLIVITAFTMAWLTPPSLAVDKQQVSHAAD